MHQSLPCRHSPIIYWSMLSYCPLIPRIVLAPHSPPLAPLLSKTSYCAFLSKRGCLVFGPILSSDLNIGARCNKYCLGWKYSPISFFLFSISNLKTFQPLHFFLVHLSTWQTNNQTLTTKTSHPLTIQQISFRCLTLLFKTSSQIG